MTNYHVTIHDPETMEKVFEANVFAGSTSAARSKATIYIIEKGVKVDLSLMPSMEIHLGEVQGAPFIE